MRANRNLPGRTVRKDRGGKTNSGPSRTAGGRKVAKRKVVVVVAGALTTFPNTRVQYLTADRWV